MFTRETKPAQAVDWSMAQRPAKSAMTCLSSNVVRSRSSIGLEVGIYVRVTILAGHVQLLLTLQ